MVKLQKFIGFAPLGAHEEAEELMYKIYYSPNRMLIYYIDYK